MCDKVLLAWYFALADTRSGNAYLTLTGKHIPTPPELLTPCLGSDARAFERTQALWVERDRTLDEASDPGAVWKSSFDLEFEREDASGAAASQRLLLWSRLSLRAKMGSYVRKAFC